MPAATSSSRTPFVLGRPGRWPERLDLRRNKEHVFGDFVLHVPVCERARPSLWHVPSSPGVVVSVYHCIFMHVLDMSLHPMSLCLPLHAMSLCVCVTACCVTVCHR